MLDMIPAVHVDFAAEVAELHEVLRGLSEDDWGRPTLFKAWTPRDIVAHLHDSDLLARAAVLGNEAFAVARRRMQEDVAAGAGALEQARRTAADLDSSALLTAWQRSAVELAGLLGGLDPRQRLPWFGPDMGVSMFATARLMETWAHGQAIYDMLARPRTPTARLRHVVVIGVRTYGFCFANRRREQPGPPPHVRLEAPSGETWTCNDPQEDERIEGSALDFCLTVTQVRHVRDTSLRVTGSAARAWMEIAQCFAGPPVDPPPPGLRLGLGSP
ncbi:MAG: TIGR03084 family protein [Deltaproteobacteria bacterium]|nr:TIGR03084 family protein [Deltaproteobacteria bacterium]